MQIVLASRNQKKIAEMRVLLRAQGGPLADVDVLSLDDIGFTGEIEETGSTFRENAEIKAAVPAAYGYIGVADDSGLSVDALGGAPGVYSARYAGDGHNDADNNEKLLSELADVPDGQRGAHYVCAIACVFPDGRRFTVEERCDGYILRGYQGDGGFGYDPLFFYPPFQKTFAEIPMERKNLVSHRAQAVAAFAARLGNYVRAVPEMSGKQRAALRSLANDIQPVFQIGKGGLTEEIYRQIGNALEARELVKITVLESCPVSVRNAADLCSLSLGAHVVSVVGRRMVLYRESEKNKKIFLK